MTDHIKFNSWTGRWTSNVPRNHVLTVEEHGGLKHLKSEHYLLLATPEKMLTSPLLVETFEDDNIVVLADAVSWSGGEPKFISRYGTPIRSRSLILGRLPDGQFIGLSQRQMDRVALAGGSRPFPRRLWYLPCQAAG